MYKGSLFCKVSEAGCTGGKCTGRKCNKREQKNCFLYIFIDTFFAVKQKSLLKCIWKKHKDM